MEDGHMVCPTQSSWLSSGGMETSTKHPQPGNGTTGRTMYTHRSRLFLMHLKVALIRGRPPFSHPILLSCFPAFISASCCVKPPFKNVKVFTDHYPGFFWLLLFLRWVSCRKGPFCWLIAHVLLRLSCWYHGLPFFLPLFPCGSICGALQRCSGNNPWPGCTVLGRHPFSHLNESCPVADPRCLSAELDELRAVDPVAASLGA